ncbi:MAG: ABC transporter ATP-binding protein [Psychrobium sp.]|nr:ABC transporter ATP-binding protein [Psychrobium sp.]
MLKLKNINKTYQTDKIETIALNDINLTVNKGEFISIMGPSGCGKSTLLNIIGLLDKPSSGEISISDQQITSYQDKVVASLRNKKIGFIFQSFHLINDLRVIDNVELPLLYRDISAKERRSLALAALERVGLSARTTHFPSQLSGGQQQRVAIARAIVGKPALLLADEPTGNLDSHMGNEIMKILESLHQDDGTTIVMVTHDEEEAKRTQRIVRVYDGQLVAATEQPLHLDATA